MFVKVTCYFFLLDDAVRYIKQGVYSQTLMYA